MRTVLLFTLFLTRFVRANDVEQWKQAYATKAATRGIPKAYVLEILKDFEPDEKVIERDRNQVLLDPDRTYPGFMRRWLREDNARISQGIEMLEEHQELLQKVEDKYDVEKEIIVALWGTETLYGQITGDYDVISSLATLAYDGRRRRFYEIQLNAALRMLRGGHVQREDMKGSWAGATGQCQFMPSNIPGYAQDFDGDGKKDIWTNKADVFASIAYLLKKGGWKKGSSIGSLSENTKNFKGDLNIYRNKKQYAELGFTNLNGNWYVRRAATIPLKESPVILRGGNYEPLLKWNNSSLFAAFNITLLEGFKQASE